MTTGAVSDVQSSSQIVTANKPTPAFYRPEVLPVSLPTSDRVLKKKLSHSTELLTLSSPGSLLTLSLTFPRWGKIAELLVHILMA